MLWESIGVILAFVASDFTTLAEEDHAVAIEVLNDLCLIQK